MASFLKRLADDPIGYGVLFMAGLMLGVLLTYKNDDEPIHYYTYYLPDAVAGQPYEVEVELAGVWRDWFLKVEANRYLDIERLSPTRIRLSHDGNFHDDETAYGIWVIGTGGHGGGRSHVRHEYHFYVAVRDVGEPVVNDCLTVVDAWRDGAVHYEPDDKRACTLSTVAQIP